MGYISPMRCTGWLLCLTLACTPTAADPPAAPEPAPTAATVATPPPTAPQPALITDEQCIAKGGRVITEQTYAHLNRRERDEPVTPFRICKVSSPKNGETCKGDEDCAGGRCFCQGALSRPNPMNDPALAPLDHTPGEGRCSDEPVPSGDWFCLVSGGQINLHGIIVD